MKHTMTYGLATILMLSLFSGCDESSNTTTPDTTGQEQTDTISSTNSIPLVEIPVEEKNMQLSANPGIDEILLKWEAVKETTEYILEWGMSKEDMDETITLNADETQFLHTELEPAAVYYYRITAILGTKKEVVSNVLEVHTGDREKTKQSDVAY